jgi:ketosteroid isomerase-like protein
MDDTGENKNIVEEFLKTFSTGDVARIIDALHEEATWWVSGDLQGMSGTYDGQGFAKLIGGVADVYETGALQITPVSMTAEGNRVAVEARSYAKLKNGRVYEPSCHFLFEIAGNGKILHVKEYLDTKHAYDIFFQP